LSDQKLSKSAEGRIRTKQRIEQLVDVPRFGQTSHHAGLVGSTS